MGSKSLPYLLIENSEISLVIGNRCFWKTTSGFIFFYILFAAVHYWGVHIFLFTKLNFPYNNTYIHFFQIL